jgi:lysophospholipase L1-like esterase
MHEIGKEIRGGIMKKVALLGDSIRLLGYGTKVPELLGEEYEVFQPDDNCRFVKYTLRMLFDLKAEIEGSDVIHWNNGLWDIPTGLFEDGEPFTNLEEYVQNMLRVAKELKKLGKRVIFATTTPVHPEYPYNKNEIIEQYNAAIVPKLKEIGIEINDLYSLVSKDIDTYICEDQIHLSEAGIELCSKQVADLIKAK